MEEINRVAKASGLPPVPVCAALLFNVQRCLGQVPIELIPGKATRGRFQEKLRVHTTMGGYLIRSIAHYVLRVSTYMCDEGPKQRLRETVSGIRAALGGLQPYDETLDRLLDPEILEAARQGDPKDADLIMENLLINFILWSLLPPGVSGIQSVTLDRKLA